MDITLNSKPLHLDCTLSVASLLEMQNIPSGGTAVAVNGKMVKRDDWDMRMISEGDDIIVISAAYGG